MMSDDTDNSMMTPQGPVTSQIPEGDDRERLVCTDCGFINYENPKIIAGAVCTWEDKYLLCERAIEPRLGYWTIPAGFMELHESVAEGAAREVVEESGAQVEIEGLLGVFEIPRISQVYMVYRARMLSPDLDPGPESLSAALFDWDDIPWDDLAFPSVVWSLNKYKDGGPGPHFEIHR
jgi:ADP-ribose pyrophosphatase YjhB (NUDIX family)